MRGGAIFLIVWAFLNALLLATDWFWSHNGFDTALTGFTVVSILVWAVVLIAWRRESIRRGPPSAETEPEAFSTASMGAVMFAWGLGSVVFGFEFGHFLIYFGIGLAVVALGVLAREYYSERRLLRRWRQGNRR